MSGDQRPDFQDPAPRPVAVSGPGGSPAAGLEVTPRDRQDAFWRAHPTVVARPEAAGEPADPLAGRWTDALTFAAVEATNVARCRRWHNGFPGGDDAWTGADWSNAMMGEAGEAANVVKKLRRGETGHPGAVDPDRDRLVEALGDELADTFLYLQLLAAFYGVDLSAAIVRKFNVISVREGFPERLTAAALNAERPEPVPVVDLDARAVARIVREELAIADGAGGVEHVGAGPISQRVAERVAALNGERPDPGGPHPFVAKSSNPVACLTCDNGRGWHLHEVPDPATTEPTLDEIGAWLIEHRGWDSADVDELREGMACARAALIREQDAGR